MKTSVMCFEMRGAVFREPENTEIEALLWWIPATAQPTTLTKIAASFPDNASSRWVASAHFRLLCSECGVTILFYAETRYHFR